MLPFVAVALAAVVSRLPYCTRLLHGDDYWFLDHTRSRTLLQAILEPDPIGTFFRPVGDVLYFWVLQRLGGESPWIYHASNLALLLVVTLALLLLAQRLAGIRVAVFAGAFLAVHYAADVPILWAAGSQDLIAVACALIALHLHLSRRTWAAAGVLLVGMLAKETIAGVPLICVLMDHQSGARGRELVRRMAPQLLALAVWGAVFLWAANASRVVPSYVGWTALAPLAAIFHLAHVGVGLEWDPGGAPWGSLVRPGPLQVLSLLLAAGAVGWAFYAARRGARRRDRPGDFSTRRLVLLGLGWAAVGALPVALVIRVWSAYQYLFALCGAALLAGALVRKSHPFVAALTIAVLGLLSAGSGSLASFSTEGAVWEPRSHVNNYYLERATRYLGRYLEDLRRLAPDLPARTSVFVSGVPAFVGLQAGDGAVLRWAYQDTTLHSYYLSEFSRSKLRGPAPRFFGAIEDSLADMNPTQDLVDIAVVLLLTENARAAREAVLAEREKRPGYPRANYVLAWIEWGRGDTLSAKVALEAAGVVPQRADPRLLGLIRDRLATGEDEAALRLAGLALNQAGLDGELHGILADLGFATESRQSAAVIEAYAACVLQPADPAVWRRWAFITLSLGVADTARESLERYAYLAGGLEHDPEARVVLESLRTAGPP